MSTGERIWESSRRVASSDTEATCEVRQHHDVFVSLGLSKGEDIDTAGAVGPRDIEERVQSHFTALIKRVVKLLIKDILEHMV